MGAVAGRLADHIVVTSDNPLTEDPASIMDQILLGLGGRDVAAQADREKAIEYAVLAARPGDVVVIAGKGHEDYQILPDGRGGTFTRHFDDREIARAALRRRSGAAGGADRPARHGVGGYS
jgi:UDP-N-acetylmuramoyl-L-alanyl-D-glutamate--2,6-diaminopimelate ligase